MINYIVLDITNQVCDTYELKENFERYMILNVAQLNITSMMDMMTIILVFLLKSFGENAITVKPSDKMRLPFNYV